MANYSQKPTLTKKQRTILTEIINGRSSRSDHIKRAKIILLSHDGQSDTKIAEQLTINRGIIGTWRRRWLEHADKLETFESREKGIHYKRRVIDMLCDLPRSGTPSKFTPEQVCKIIKVSCENPEDSGVPLSHWSLSSLALELSKRKIVKSISTSQLAIFLKALRDKTPQSERVDTHTHRR